MREFLSDWEVEDLKNPRQQKISPAWWFTCHSRVHKGTELVIHCLARDHIWRIDEQAYTQGGLGWQIETFGGASRRVRFGQVSKLGTSAQRCLEQRPEPLPLKRQDCVILKKAYVEETVLLVSVAPGTRVFTKRCKAGNLCSAAVVMREIVSNWDLENLKNPGLQKVPPTGCFECFTMLPYSTNVRNLLPLPLKIENSDPIGKCGGRSRSLRWLRNQTVEVINKTSGAINYVGKGEIPLVSTYTP